MVGMLTFFDAVLHLDTMAMLQTGSYVGLAFIVFAESGLLIGIFLPGDSLLFAAGLIASGGFFSLNPLIATVVVAAIIGDSVGYWFGAQAGSRLFNKEDSRFFKREYVERTERFYLAYGGRAVILARFLPIVRTLAPMLAGVSSMKYRTFLAYNVIGGLLWGAGMILLGFSVGSVIPNSEKYILPLTLIIVVLSFLPIIINLVRGKRALQ